MGLKLTLPGVDGQGVILHLVLQLAHLQEGHLLVILTLQMMMGYPVMPLIRTGPFAGGMGVEGVERAKVVVTSMIHAPLEGGKRKRMDFLVRSKSPNLVARRDILMMWLTLLGSGPTVSLTTVITMRIPISCPW